MLHFLLPLTVVATGAVIVRLVHSGLARVYPIFLCLMALNVALQFPAVLFGLSSRRYFYIYAAVEPIMEFFYVFVVLELFSKIFRNYPGLRSLSRLVLGVGGALAPVGFVLAVAAPGVAIFSSKYLTKMVAFQRGLDMTLVIFILLMLFFISRYPIRLPRNTIVHCTIYCIWFLGEAFVFLGSSLLSGASVYLVNVSLSVLQVGCCLGWAMMLSREGETRETRIRQRISRQQEESLIHQLGTLNSLLLRVGGSIRT